MCVGVIWLFLPRGVVGGGVRLVWHCEWLQSTGPSLLWRLHSSGKTCTRDGKINQVKQCCVLELLIF